jgi:hypothetical protein
MRNMSYFKFSITIFLIVIINCNPLFTQNKSVTDFEKLMVYFNNPESIINYKELPYKMISSEGNNLETLIDKELVEQIRGKKYNQQLIGIFPGKILFNKQMIGLTIITHFGAGGFSEFQELMIFNHNGELTDQYQFGKLLSGGGESLHKENVFCSDSLMIFQTTDTANFDEIIESIELETIAISEKGKISFQSKEKVNLERNYYWTSTETIQDSIISKFSKEQLTEMRNEIYASKGYIFKSDKWREYFNKKQWYEPKTENVEDKLSKIEILNISKILKYEKR